MFGRKIGSRPFRAGLLVVCLALLCSAAGAWTVGDDTYASRIDHTINGVAGTTQSYSPVAFTLSTASGTNGDSVIYTGGTTQADWRDVRFASTSDVVYPHWIRSTNATAAEVIVNVTSIPEGGAVIRIYYDSDTAAQTSSGVNTCMFFEDFLGASINSGAWTVGGSGVFVSGGICTVAQYGGGATKITSKTAFATNTQVYFRALLPESATSAHKIGYCDSSDSTYANFRCDTGSTETTNTRTTSSQGLSSPVTTDYHTFGIKRNGTTSVMFETDGTLRTTHATIVPPGTIPFNAQSATWSKNISIDYVAVLSYSYPEPTHGAYVTIAPPTAAFSADVTSGDVPLPVQFTDASTNTPTAWAWDFDNDGDTDSTEQNPVYEYVNEGVYTVKLTVTNAAGSDDETKADYIAVTQPYDPPLAAFSANVTSGYTPLAVQFTDASTGPPTEWAWEFTGPGEFYDLDLNQNPTLTFTVPGTYSVSLQASNPAGTDYENKTGYITVLALPAGPVASFTADVVSGHAPLTVQFTDTSTGSPTAWAWDFDGDAVADSTDQNPTYEYASNGTYTVTLQVSNAGGTNLTTKAGYVYVGELTAKMLRASFSYTKPVGTAPFSVSFADTSASNGTYARMWDFGDGATSTEPAPVHEYATAGKYDVELVITSDYTQDKSTARKAVMAYPAAAVSPLPTTTYGAHMTEIMESNWNVSVIGPIIPRAYTDALTPLTGDTGVGNMIFWGIIWVGVFMILFLRQGTPWLAALVGLVVGPGILTFLPPEWAHVGYICLAVTIGCSFFVIALGRFRST